MKKKQKSNVLLLIACIISYFMVGVSAFLFVAFAFNIGQISDIYLQILSENMMGAINVNEQITMACIEFAIVGLLELYFASFYLKGWRFRVNSPQYGRMLVGKSIFQIICSNFLAGLLVLICGLRMSKGRRQAPEENHASERSEFLSNYKLEAMSEAVSRLKELKEKGAISEEEYYATLNKILES